MHDMNPLLTLAIHAARSAGVVIMEEYEHATITIKDDGSPVTSADTRANEIIMDILKETGIPILSEESLHISLPYPERLWIIDPLDGTRDFIEKTKDFAVMIGLIEHGRPTLGVVYLPAQDKLYFALRDHGSYLEEAGNTKKLTVGTNTETLRCIRSVHHFGVRGQKMRDILNFIELPHGSIGVKSGMIAENEGDISFSFGNLGEWDVCAPEIILTEAGGLVTDTDGNPLFYGNVDHRIQNGVAFSNGVCHEKLLSAMNEVL